MAIELQQNTDLFTHLAQPQNLSDPYPIYAHLRSRHPVFISSMPPNFMLSQMYVLSRYEDVNMALKHRNVGRIPPNASDSAREYEKRLQSSITSQLKDNVVTFMDPPRHTAVRAIMNKAFSPKIVEDLKPKIEDIAQFLIHEMKGRAAFDLKEEFARPLPVMVIAELLGVPRSDWQKIKIWSQSLIKSVDAAPMTKEEYRQMHAYAREAIQYFNNIFKQRTADPGKDIISNLIHAKETDRSLSHEELTANCLFLMVAGHETSLNMITNGIMAFLRNPDQLEQFSSNTTEMGKRAVAEVLRYDSPVQLLSRIVQAPIHVAGVDIGIGEQLGLFIGAANRDPSEFDQPDQFDISRKELASGRAHLAFGMGSHYCSGATLAVLEGIIAFKTLFDAFPNLKVDLEAVRYRPSFSMREVLSLPATAG